MRTSVTLVDSTAVVITHLEHADTQQAWAVEELIGAANDLIDTYGFEGYDEDIICALTGALKALSSGIISGTIYTHSDE